jgi:hypothetical protein
MGVCLVFFLFVLFLLFDASSLPPSPLKNLREEKHSQPNFAICVFFLHERKRGRKRRRKRK